MAGTYSVTNLATESTELLNEIQLRKRFAPELGDGIEAETERKEWLDAFVSMPVLQKGHGVKVELLDPEEVFKAADALYAEKKKELDAAKAAVDTALLDVLRNIDEDEIKAGEIHTTSDTAKVKLTIVEYWVAKGRPNLKELIEKTGRSLPTHVTKELRRIQTKRKQVAEKRSQ